MFFYFLIGIIFQNCLAIDGERVHKEYEIPHEFPHHAAIFAQMIDNAPPKFFCSGSIISPEWILTTAQCASKHTALFVQAGKYRININEFYQQDRRIIKSIVHNDYESESLNQTISKNDIALLKLESPLAFNDYVKAITLPIENNLSTGFYHFSSWNVVPVHIILGHSKELESVKLKILDNDSCAREINSELLTKNLSRIEIDDSQMCTSHSKENEGLCIFHSGSPLIKYRETTGINKTAELIGIFSWTEYPCEKLHSAAVYTRVSSYIDWILRSIWFN